MICELEPTAGTVKFADSLLTDLVRKSLPARACDISAMKAFARISSEYRDLTSAAPALVIRQPVVCEI